MVTSKRRQSFLTIQQTRSIRSFTEQSAPLNRQDVIPYELYNGFDSRYVLHLPDLHQSQAMATDAFVPGNLVLVDFPGSGNWPCQVSRIISKNWRQVEYFGGGEIGDAHVQVIRGYDEATKDDLEEFIPQKKMDKDPVLRKAVKQINQKLAGKNTRISGVGITTRSESKKISYKKETGGKRKSKNTSEKKEVSAAIKETRKIRQKKEFTGNKNDVKKTLGKGELKKMKIAGKKAFIGARNKTETIPGINKIIRTPKRNDKKKEHPRNLRAGVSDGLINADNPEGQQSRPNNEGPLANTNTRISQDINSHLLLNSGSSSTGLGTSCGNLGGSSSGTIINANSDSFRVSVSTPISHSTSVNNNHGVADDVDIIIKCEIDEDAYNNSDTVGTEDLNLPTTPEDAVLPSISATSENGGAFPAEDISAPGSSDSSETGGTFPAEHISASEVATTGSLATSEISGPNTTEDISAQEATAPRSSASSDTDNSSASSSVGIMPNNLGDSDTVKLNISMEMTPNTFSQISPALLAFVSQPNVTVHFNMPQ